MAEEYTLLVDNLEDKVSRIVDRYKVLRTEVSNLSAENEKLKNELIEAKGRMAELQNDYSTLKVSKVLEFNSGDVNSTKLKINELVREIDKCIALLNR